MVFLSKFILLALAGSAIASPVGKRQADDSPTDVTPIDATPTDATPAVATPDASTPGADSLGGADTQNGLQGACKGTTVIFARGTTEPGNVGLLAGPPFFEALSAKLGGDLAVQGVDYPADIPGFLAGGDPQGSATMAQLVMQAMTQCPSTKVIMSGYSQGGQLVHNAAKLLPAATASNVAGAVIFGDPDDGSPVQGVANLDVICHDGDNICEHGDLVLPPHLTYSVDADSAAASAAQFAGQ